MVVPIMEYTHKTIGKPIRHEPNIRDSVRVERYTYFTDQAERHTC